MANIVRIPVQNPDDLLNAGAYGAGAVIRFQTSATQAGAYADVAGTGSTPTIPLVAATYNYAGYDPSGASTSWYRYRFENAGGTRTSDYVDSFQLAGGQNIDAVLGSVKRRLGMSPTDLTDDDLIVQEIVAVRSYIENYTGRTFDRDPLGSGTVTYTFDGFDALEQGQLLLIPQGIQSVSLLQVATNTGATLQTVPSTDYFLRPTVQERAPNFWPATELWMTDIPSTGNPAPTFNPGNNTVAITGVWGFAAYPPVLSELEATTVVRAWIGRQSGQTDTVGSDVLGRPVISRFLSGRDMETLASFRIKTVAIL